MHAHPFENRGELKSLTSMRGIAACTVMFFHLRQSYRDISSVAWPLHDIDYFRNGHLWVDYFFVLSGFILAYRYAPTFAFNFPSIKRFLISRWIRIYPVHFVTLIAFATFVYFRDGAVVFDKREAFSLNFLLMHTWGWWPGFNFNFPSWSLSAEWMAYWVFPLMMLVTFVTRKVWVLNLIVMVGLLSAFYYLVEIVMNGKMDLTYVHGWKRCLFEFTLGVFLFLLRNDLPIHRYPIICDALSAALLVGLFFYLNQPDWPEFYFVFFSLGLVFLLSGANGPVTWILETRPFYFIGLISYSIYMWHALGGSLMRQTHIWLGSPEWSAPFAYSTLAILMLAIILVSYLSYSWLEQDLGKHLKNKLL